MGDTSMSDKERLFWIFLLTCLMILAAIARCRPDPGPGIPAGTLALIDSLRSDSVRSAARAIAVERENARLEHVNDSLAREVATSDSISRAAEASSVDAGARADSAIAKLDSARTLADSTGLYREAYIERATQADSLTSALSLLRDANVYLWSALDSANARARLWEVRASELENERDDYARLSAQWQRDFAKVTRCEVNLLVTRMRCLSRTEAFVAGVAAGLGGALVISNQRSRYGSASAQIRAKRYAPRGRL